VTIRRLEVQEIDGARAAHLASGAASSTVGLAEALEVLGLGQGRVAVENPGDELGLGLAQLGESSHCARENVRRWLPDRGGVAPLVIDG
jgi:hypothetical protein